ncbi:MAG: hypothetical protein V3T72_04135, partial [Thermoanaerobaculia bacterium]
YVGARSSVTGRIWIVIRAPWKDVDRQLSHLWLLKNATTGTEKGHFGITELHSLLSRRDGAPAKAFVCRLL